MTNKQKINVLERVVRRLKRCLKNDAGICTGLCYHIRRASEGAMGLVDTEIKKPKGVRSVYWWPFTKKGHTTRMLVVDAEIRRLKKLKTKR